MSEKAPWFFENGHDFRTGESLGLKTLATAIMCKNCGIIRNRDGSNKPCPGRVAIGLRAAPSESDGG